MIDNIREKELTGHKNGAFVLLLTIVLYIAAIIGMISVTDLAFERQAIGGIIFFIICILYVCFGWILFLGLKILKPGEALVLTLFGKYVGTLKGDGFFFVNPFCTAFNPAADTKLEQSGDTTNNSKKALQATNINMNLNSVSIPNKKISLKVMTLSNSRQKVNDVLGNPVEIAVAVMWKVSDTAKAVFTVDNFKEYLSLQCDTAVRNVVKLYPYDITDNVDTTGDGQADDGSLRGSTEIVASRIKEEIQSKVENAGLEIVDARITYLAYAPEIAAAMLQRQQAAAIVDAR